ncbi:hypothetical protein QFC24_005843 [Naganishia onofrii]|uniref:Uncharacterized protein n=1 Tax=Naganishia onofrii TaxID=1851511 RepID=A0ACC2X9C7_9TREE|nr:hypothetical protein QFC24_005843 [Naganishia onofrii]
MTSNGVWTGARILSRGHVEQFNREGLTIGVDYRPSSIPRATEDARLDRFVGVLKAGGSEVAVVQDIQSERWVKVIWCVGRKEAWWSLFSKK